MTVYQPENMALYLNGQRIPGAFRCTHSDTPEPELLPKLQRTPHFEFKFKMALTDDGERFFEELRRRCIPTRRTREPVERYRRKLRHYLVRLAGHVAIPAEFKRLTENEKMLYAALGVGVPRSLR